MNRNKKKRFMTRLRHNLSDLLIFILVISVFLVGGKYIWKQIIHSAGKSDSLLSFKPETYSTNMPELTPELDGFFNTFKTLVYASQEADEAKKDFLQAHPEIRTMSIAANYMTGDVNIRIEPRKVVSEITVEGEKAFLAEDGTIMSKAIGDYVSLPFSVSLSTHDISEHLTNFLYKLGERHNDFSRTLKEVRCGSGEDSCVLLLEDGTRVNWGTMFYTSRKIEELNNILSVAGKNNPGSYSGKLDIDMRYCVSLGRSFYKTQDNAITSGKI